MGGGGAGLKESIMVSLDHFFWNYLTSLTMDNGSDEKYQIQLNFDFTIVLVSGKCNVNSRYNVKLRHVIQ